MKKREWICFSVIIVSLIMSIFAFLPINKSYKVDPWMSKVSDNTKIKDLSIPGTHDSGAMHSLFDVAGKCQDVSIIKQLDMGVRFFDIRLQLVDNELNVVHSFVDQELKFEWVLNYYKNFLKDYNSEFIIMSIKEDAESKDSSKSFKDVLVSLLAKYNDYICYDNKLPETVKEARGKVYILSRYELDFGISAYQGWKDSTTFELNDLYVQDNYCINDIDEKKKDIKATLEYSKNNNDKLVLNFTSCYIDGAFPPSYAGSAAKEINPWFIDYINENENDRLGIIVADFMTGELATAIYRRNMA